jgi:hypothetical protein
MTKVDTLKNWIALLRGGTYKQGRQKLRTRDNCFCCMGVLGDMDNPEWRADADTFELNNFSRCYLSDEQLSKYGLCRTDQAVLTDMNDQGDSFDTIADRIERVILPRVQGEENGG